VKEAAEKLSLSSRQVIRLRKRVREHGSKAIAHVGRGKTSPKKISEEVRQQILELARGKYRGFNDTHMWEKLNQKEGVKVGRETLRCILRQAGIGAVRRHRPPKHRKRRERRPQEGLMLIFDGSPHDWLEGRGPKLNLVGAIDDATGKMSWGSFEDAETTEGYLGLLAEIARRKGVPASVYADRHSIFVTTRKSWTLEEELQGHRQPTQVGRALQQMGISLILAQSPQAKGRIERLWQTLQDRLISEMRLRGISSKNEANAYLQQEFIHEFNARFAKPAANPQKAYRPWPVGLKRQRVFCLKYSATVKNDNTVRLKGLIFDIPPHKSRYGFAKAKVEVNHLLNDSWQIYYQDTLIYDSKRHGGPVPAKMANSYTPRGVTLSFGS
jgi:transposase